MQAVREYEEREKRIKVLDKEASCSTQLSLYVSPSPPLQIDKMQQTSENAESELNTVKERSVSSLSVLTTTK